MFVWQRLRGIVIAVLTCVLVAVAGSAHAQNITGQINGTVRDSSGAAIVGATINVTNTDTKELVRTIKTGKSGEYTASLLQVGNYNISAQAPDFGEETLTGIAVDVDASITRDFRLTPGNKAEVTVNANGLTPNIETNENSTLINNTEMQELALNTRNFQQVLLLQPGVSYGGPDELPTGQVDPTGARNSHQLSVNGLQPSQVLFTLDGADMLNHTSNGQVSVFPSVGAINQIQTIRNNYGAQFGGGGGAQVTIATKAGAADFHGEAYFFYRNAGLNATPYFDLLTDPPTAKPDIHYSNFGYDVGGPVFIPKLTGRSNTRTFFFFSQEFRRIDNPTTRQAGNIPTLANTYGYFKSAVCLSLNSSGKCDATQPRAVMVNNSPFPGLNYRICVADDPIPCPAGAPMANAVASAYMKDVFRPSTLLAPAAFNPAKPNNVVLSQNSPTSETQEEGRIDHQFSERLSGFARVIYDPITQMIPNSIYSAAGDPGVSTTTVKSYGADFLGHLTWTARPNTVLEFGASYLPYQTQAIPTGFAVAANSPDLNGLINLPFANTTGRVPTIVLVNDNNVGAVGPFTDKSETYQFFENTTHTVGRHVLYFGTNLEHLTDSSNLGTKNSGVFNFSAVASGGNTQFDQSFGILLGGNATSFTQSSVDPVSHPDENLYEVYVQDIWRATSTLTLNGGVRYSIFQAPGDYSSDTSANHQFPLGKLGGFQPEAYNPALAPTIGYDGSICTTGNVGATACTGLAANPNYNPLNGVAGGGAGPSPYGRAISKTPFLDFAPRVGFAWNVYGDGRTSLRGGFGMFYNQQPLITFQNAISGNPAYVQNPIYLNPPSFANPGQVPVGSGGAVNTITGVARNFTQPYVEAWSLGVQQQLSKVTLLDISYVGNNTQHLQGEEDLNQPLPDVYIGTGVTGCVNGVATAACEPTNNGSFLCVPGNAAFKCPFESAINRIRPYLGYGPINFQSTRFFADYNGLQVSVTHRAAKSLTFGASYTYSKALANSGGPPNGGFNQEQFDPQNRFDLKSEWGPTLLDRRHIATLHAVYQPPVQRQFHGFLNQALNGWELSSIIEYRSGSWFTAHSDGIDAAGQGALGTGSNAKIRPEQSRNANNFTKTQAAFFDAGAFSNQIPLGQPGGNEKIGNIEGPGYQNYNLDLFKNFEIRERTRFQLRGECFNCVNHVNFQSVGTQLGNSNFGAVINAYANRTMQLGAKLTF